MIILQLWLQVLCDLMEEFGGPGKIPIGIIHMSMAEVCGQFWDMLFNVDAFLIPIKNCANSKSVAKIMKAGSSAVIRIAQSYLA